MRRAVHRGGSSASGRRSSPPRLRLGKRETAVSLENKLRNVETKEQRLHRPFLTEEALACKASLNSPVDSAALAERSPE
jgi:hypothetical protein